MKKSKISNIQLALLVIGFFHGSTTIANPGIGAKRDAWIAIIIGTLLGFLLNTLYLYLSKINHGRTLSETIENCFGRFLGFIFSILYILYFLYKAALNTRAFGDFMATVSYPETPLTVLLAVLIIIIVYMVRNGLAVMGKTSEILVPLLPLAIFTVTLSLTKMPDFTGLKPIFLEFAPIIYAALDITTSIFGDFIIFLMILPYTNNEKGRFKASYIALLITGILLMIITTRNIIIIGPTLSEVVSYPSHIAAQMIPGMSIDPLVDMNLLFGGGFKVGICLYAMCRMTADLFRLDAYKPLVSAFGLLILVTSLWIFPNSLQMQRWSKDYVTIFIAVPVQIILPLLMFIITLAKNRKTTLIKKEE